MIVKSKYFEQLPPPLEGEYVIQERLNDFMWVTKEKVIHVVPREKQIQLTEEQTKQQLADFKKEFGDGKYFILTVFNPATKMTKADRDFAADVLPEILDGIAIICTSAMGRIAINFLLSIRRFTYPIKLFPDKETALDWIEHVRK